MNKYTYEELMKEINHSIEVQKALGNRQVWFNTKQYDDVDVDYAISSLTFFGYEVIKNPYDTRFIENNTGTYKILYNHILIGW